MRQKIVEQYFISFYKTTKKLLSRYINQIPLILMTRSVGGQVGRIKTRV